MKGVCPVWTPFFMSLAFRNAILGILSKLAIYDLCCVKTIRLIARLCFFLVFTTAIVAEIWLRNKLWGEDIRRSMRIRRRWARKLLRGVGLSITIEGTPPLKPCLIVSNHRSYLDPILMLCDVPGYPVAKAELANWPLIGKGAKMAGILYLKRENAGSRSSTLRQMLDKIEAGFPVIIFPEGTTSDMPDSLPFKLGAFKLAAQSNIPVVPTAIIYADKRDYWVAQESFLTHAKRRFGSPKIEVKLCYGLEMYHENPETLLLQSKTWIDSVLLKAHQG